VHPPNTATIAKPPTNDARFSIAIVFIFFDMFFSIEASTNKDPAKGYRFGEGRSFSGIRAGLLED
jgi:hypothetical protein